MIRSCSFVLILLLGVVAYAITPGSTYSGQSDIARSQHFLCVDLGELCVIIHPDSDPDRIEEILGQRRALPPAANMLGYNQVDRWESTATDEDTGPTGDPITLLWGFLPDGVVIPGGEGSPDLPSDLHAVFDSTFTTPDQWKTKMRNAISRWDVVLGATLVEVSYDDSALFPDSGGALGIRPDIRIGGRPIDGPYGILAYNYFPWVGGDMVLDTDDAFLYGLPLDNFRTLKNVTAHELGHGLGLGHSTPNDGTKLMGGLDPPLIGPQDDDIRGGQRLYGDILEPNDSLGEVAFVEQVDDSLLVDNLSIDNGRTDVDWLAFAVPGGQISIEVTPVGSTYLIGDEGGPPPTLISTDSVSDPDFRLYDSTGTVLLVEAGSAGLGEAEILSEFPVPYSGRYGLEIFRKSGTGGDVQRYSLLIRNDLEGAAEMPGWAEITNQGPQLTIGPNPFSPLTTVRFSIPDPTPVILAIHDVVGRQVIVLAEEQYGRGKHSLLWDGRDAAGAVAAPGMYFARLKAGDEVVTRKITLIR